MPARDIDNRHNQYKLDAESKKVLQKKTQLILNLLKERDGINDDIKEVYANLKAENFDVKAVRKAIAAKRARDKEGDEKFSDGEAMLDLYRVTLGWT